jgi:hypothetical protein
MSDTKNRKAKFLHKLHAQEEPGAKSNVDSSRVARSGARHLLDAFTQSASGNDRKDR